MKIFSRVQNYMSFSIIQMKKSYSYQTLLFKKSLNKKEFCICELWNLDAPEKIIIDLFQHCHSRVRIIGHFACRTYIETSINGSVEQLTGK